MDSIPKSARQSGNVTNRAQLEFRRGGAGVLCDDGRGWCERTAHRRPRTDTGLKQQKVTEPIFDAAPSRTEELFATAIGTARGLIVRSGFLHGKILFRGHIFYNV